MEETMFKTLIFSLLTTILLTTINLCSFADFTVRVIYFRPIGAPATPVAQIRAALEQTQTYYADEMEKHEYGRKTFRLERDNAGEIFIHTVRGRRIAQHYFRDTQATLNAELPENMKNNNDILLCFIGGLNQVAGGWNGNGRGVFGNDCGGCKGRAAIANKNGDFALSTVKHELGHTFGLYHNLQGKFGANFLMWFDGGLEAYEARWLDKNRYFNDGVHIANPPPSILKIARPTAMQKNNTDYVEVSADIDSAQSLYQAQIFRSSDQCVVDWHRLEGHKETVDFQIKRTDLTDDFKLWIHVQDITGNQSVRKRIFVLPPKQEEFKVVTKHKDLDKLVDTNSIPRQGERLQVSVENKTIMLWGALKRGY